MDSNQNLNGSRKNIAPDNPYGTPEGGKSRYTPGTNQAMEQYKGRSFRRDDYMDKTPMPTPSGVNAAPKPLDDSVELKRAYAKSNTTHSMPKEAFKLKKEPAILFPIAIAVAALIGAFIGYRAGFKELTIPGFTGKTVVDLILYLAIILLTSAVQNIAHELGHYIAGKAKGFKIEHFNIGFLTWENINGKMHFSLAGGNGSATLCKLRPAREDKQLVGYEAVYGGGIVANCVVLLLIVAALAISVLTYHPLLVSCLAASIVISAAILILNLIPATVNGVYSDGKLLSGLAKGAKYMDTVHEVQLAYGALADGANPAELNISSIEKVSKGTIYRVQKLDLILWKAIGNNQYAIAEKLARLMEKDVMKIPRWARGEYLNELCFCSCVLMHDSSRAKWYYKKSAKWRRHSRNVMASLTEAVYESYVLKSTAGLKDKLNRGRNLLLISNSKTLAELQIAVAEAFINPKAN